MLLFNRYEYNPRTDLIGKGVFSRVYKAFDREGNVAVALKIYKNTEDAGGEKPIPEKDRMLALDHPNICRYLLIEEMEKEDSFGEKESFQVCIMEWMDGGDLAGYYKSRRDLVILKKLLEDTIRGLQYLHANGMVHRHVRAANILVRTGLEGPVAQVTDFGTGKRAAGDESGLITAVQYLAPEQLNVRKYGNQGKVSYNIDYWALGICVYEMMTGDILFRTGEQDSREQIMNNILSPVLPEKINRLPEPFRSMLAACLVKDARERTRDGENLLQILQGEISGEAPVDEEETVKLLKTELPAEEPVQLVPPAEEPVLPVQEEEEVDPDATVLIRRPVIKEEEEPVKEEPKPAEEEVKLAEEEIKPIVPAQEEEEADPDATVLIRRPVIKEEEEPVREEPKAIEPVQEEMEIAADKEDDRKKATEEAEEVDEDATVLMARPPTTPTERKNPPVTPDESGPARSSGVSEPSGALGPSGSWPPGSTGNAAPSGSWPPGASGSWGASGSLGSSGTPGTPGVPPSGGTREDQMSLFNRYQYNPQTGLIGRGGFSRVYKAFDRKLNRWVALKIYKTSEFPERYSPIAEIRRVVNLDHPNICRYLDIEEIEKENTFGEKEITQICVMELLDGGNFAQYITAYKSEEVLKKLVGDVLNGLAYLHRNGIIHRDIKPANILIKETIDGPVAKITDFGISKGSDSVNSNSSSALVVSIPYMAPEQLNVKKYGVQEKISYNLDLWSLGVTIYEVITGKVLFKNNEQDSSEQIMTNIMAPELPEKIKELPEPFRSIVAHCIIKSANERAQKAEELIVLLHSNHTEIPALPLVPLRTAPEVSSTTEAPVTAPAAKVSKPSFCIDKPEVPPSPPPRIRPASAQSFPYWKMGLGVVAGAAVAFFLFWFFSGRNNSGNTDLSNSQKADTTHAHNPVVNPVSPSPTVAVADSPADKITKSREQGPDDQAKQDRKKKIRITEGQDNHTDKPTDHNASRHKTEEAAGAGDTQQPYTLELTANKDCRLFVNGESQGTVHAGGTMKIFLTAGSYTIKATSTTDNTSYSTSFEVKAANLGQVSHRRLELQ
jgi:serine/threonine protein kinase